MHNRTQTSPTLGSRMGNSIVPGGAMKAWKAFNNFKVHKKHRQIHFLGNKLNRIAFFEIKTYPVAHRIKPKTNEFPIYVIFLDLKSDGDHA